MSLAVILHASNQSDPRYLTVARLVDRLGLTRYTYGLGKWGGFGDKLITMREAANSLTAYTHLLHIDAYDVIVLGNEQQIMERYKQLAHPFVCMAEVNCWPDKNIAASYPPTDGLWHYLNSGCYMGERTAIANILNSIELKPSQDDQRVLTRYFLDHPGSIKLDYECVLFQPLLGSMHLLDIKIGSIYNRHTNTFPLVAHHHGGGNVNTGEVTKLWKE